MKRNLLILGAGAYGQLVYEVAESMNRFDKIAFLDDEYAAHPLSESAKSILELTGGDLDDVCPILGRIGELPKFSNKYNYAAVAVEDPELRSKYADFILENNCNLAILAHPKAFVSPSAILKPGCVIEPSVVVLTSAEIGKCSFVRAGAIIDHNAVVGKFCTVGCGVCVPAGAKIPDGETR